MWNTIETEEDIERLMWAFGEFHDACLREMHVWSGTVVDKDLSMWCPEHSDTRIRVLFQRQFRDPSAIEMLFEGVVAMHLVPTEGDSCSDIYRAGLLRRGDILYWSDWHEWTPDSTEEADATWIAARSVRWRDASDWMGQVLRYGPREEA